MADLSCMWPEWENHARILQRKQELRWSAAVLQPKRRALSVQRHARSVYTASLNIACLVWCPRWRGWPGDAPARLNEGRLRHSCRRRLGSPGAGGAAGRQPLLEGVQRAAPRIRRRYR